MHFHWIRTFNRFYLTAAILYAVLLFVLSHQPTLPMPRVLSFEDLLAHGIAYAILYSLLYKGLPDMHPGWILVITVLYGLSDEWHQSFVPGRVCDPWDFVADAAGGTIAMVFWRYRKHDKTGGPERMAP